MWIVRDKSHLNVLFHYSENMTKHAPGLDNCHLIINIVLTRACQPVKPVVNLTV